MNTRTEKRKAKKLLYLLQKAAESSPYAFMITTANPDNYKIIYVNPALATMSGYTAEELMGKSPIIMQGPKTDPIVQAKLHKAMRVGETFFGETINYRKDKTEFYMEWSMTPIHDEDGKITHYVGIQRNVSDRVIHEKEKDEFIGIISHEIKTPLTTIKGFVGIMQKKYLEPSLHDKKKMIEYLQTIDSELDRIIALTNNLLDTTNTRAHRLESEMELQDLDQLISGRVESLRKIVKSHKIYKRGRVNQLIRFDKQRMIQVLNNLLTNAIKYSPQSDKVIVRVTKEKFFVRVSVQDFGIGIEPENQQKIFTRYYREHLHNGLEKGSIGLGLYIVSEIIKSHGGVIGVESSPGKGSTFFFTLPLSQDEK